MADWLGACWLGWLAGWLLAWLAWLAGWLPDWLADWLAVELAGWLLVSLSSLLNFLAGENHEARKDLDFKFVLQIM